MRARSEERSGKIVDRALVEDICQRNDIAYLGLFGSFARGEETAESDVDLLVRFIHPKSLLTLVGIEMELSDLIGRPVDLVTEPSLSPYLRDRILAETQTIYEPA